MPHLSPLNWIMLFLFFSLVLFLISLSLWWVSKPKLCMLGQSSKGSLNKWFW